MTNSSATQGERAPTLSMRLLGGAEVHRNGQPVTGFLSAKAQALLYYLAVAGRPILRTVLVGLFWGDQAEDQARINLNQTLSNLRKVLGDLIAIDRQQVALAGEPDVLVDAVQLVGAAARAQHLAAAALLAAAAHYRGELLDGFQVRDAAEFEVWLQTERIRLREAAVTVLLEAARRCEQEGDGERAEQALRALLRIEPWRESAHRQLMLLLARSGARDAALAQYAACRQALAAALDVGIDEETERLYRRIRSGELAPAAPGTETPAVLRVDAGEAAAGSPGGTTAAVPLHNLPGQATPFVGRTRELREIVQCLADPECRLLTLAGPGGIGKSRLAQQAALAMLQNPALHTVMADGVYFVPLAAAARVSAAAAAIANATSFHFYDGTPPEQQLLAFLRTKHMLLVLDNFEQLLEGDGAGVVLNWVSALATQAEHLKLLVTTREALGLQEAWFYPLGGLSLPPASRSDPGEVEGLAEGEQAEAIQLFVQCARRARVGFAFSAVGDAVARICRLVDGAPLGIELAAAWLKVLTVEQVAAELERSLDILTARYQNMPLRHRSMRAVWESSWQLLAQPLRAIMRRLAFCRGGFRLEAAGQLAGASIADLATLVDKSLLRQAASGRYEMHELLRQYALERVAAHQETDAIARQHAAYYLRLLTRNEASLRGAGQRQALEELAEEQENLHQAWQSAVGAGEWELIARAQAAFYEFLQVRSTYLEGQDLFGLAAEHLDDAAGGDGNAEILASLRAHISSGRGAFAFYLGDYGRAAQLADEALAAAERAGLPAAAAFALNLQGQIAGWQGNRAAARTCLEESLRQSREIGDKAGVANTLHKLAQVHGSVGEYAEARRLAAESLDLCRQLGRPDWIGYALDVLGWATLCLGDYDACWEYYSASLRHFQAIGDRLGTALALGGLGSVEWARGGDRLLSAAAYMNESLNLCRRIGHRHHAASRLWYVGQIAVEQGNYWLAKLYAEEGRALAEEVGSRVFVAYNLCSLAAAEAGLGRPALAQNYLLSVLHLATEVTHLPPLLIALLELTRLHLAGVQEDEWESARARERRELAQASLAAILAHPACWHPYRVRARQLAEAAGLASANEESVAAQPDALAAVVAHWQALETLS